MGGSVRAVQALKQRLQSGEPVDLLAEADVCTVASLLKQYLRELPEGLVRADETQEIIDRPERGDDGPWQDLRAVLTGLPDLHHRLLTYLCRFLTEVEHHHQHNLMTTLNLATVFGPSVFRVSPGPEAMRQQETCNRVLVKLLRNCSAIFQDQDGRSGERPTNLIVVKEAHLMKEDQTPSPATPSPRSPKTPVKKAAGDDWEVSPAAAPQPRPSFSGGALPHAPGPPSPSPTSVQRPQPGAARRHGDDPSPPPPPPPTTTTTTPPPPPPPSPPPPPAPPPTISSSPLWSSVEPPDW
ncbi:LOW QUALITY PROTEIN: hypothetical protein CRUP_031619 [Coryphaenoides rupestris]|nr:LOW QUALITY PROTEIN: hypothetical protein CRUP_031619 [Coryphaenoides rupestris]